VVATGRLEAAANRLLPRWMRGGWFESLWTAVLHGPLELLDQDKVNAVNVGLVERCPADAVRYHAAERQLERLAGESDEALRIRALEAWTFWSEMAPTGKLTDAITLYTGLSGVRVYVCNTQSDDWLAGYVPLADGEDDNTDNWTRHFVVIPASGHPWTRPVVGPGLTVGPGLMVGLTMTQVELSRIRRAYRRHRPAHMVGGDIYVLFDGTTPASVLAAHDASADFSRLPLHRQMVGYGPHGMTVGPHLIVGYEFT
jgi:hypothetical protein